MRLLVTGATGFLGRYVVAEALRRGNAVRAMARPACGVPVRLWDDRGGDVDVVRADLRSRRGLVEAVAGVDAVLHLAAAKSGDLYAQYAGTVVATENLLWAMTEAGVRRIVSVSSLSVYDYRKLRSFATLDEGSPLETTAFDRDEYAHTKLVQERIVREHAAALGWDFTVLRPGVIWGKDNLWTARLGMQTGRRLWVRTGAWARLPLTYVENCAEAIVLAAERDAARGQTLNVIDDETPTQRRYAGLLRKHASPRPLILPVSWTVMRFLAGAATVTNRVCFGNRAKVPGLFVPARLHARCKPLRYSNRRIKDVLGWAPRYSLEEAMARATGAATPADGLPAAAAGGCEATATNAGAAEKVA